MPSVSHWEEVRPRRREVGHIGGTWFDLGSAAGSVTVGVQRIQIDPGKWSTPAHVEGVDEEIFFVLGGSGLSWQLNAEGPAAYEVGEGDCLVHLPGNEAHTLRAGPSGLDVLVFGGRAPDGNTVLPRARVGWMGPAFVEATPADFQQGEHPFVREAAAGEPEVGELLERPPSIVNVRDVEAETFGPGETVRSVAHDLGVAAGSIRTGLNQILVAPGKLNVPPHCHSAEEEFFVILEGEGVLLLGEEEHDVRRGSIVARPAGTRVAHAFRGGPGGLTLMSYGTREPNDIVYYPRSNKISWRGVGVIGRIERLEYWDGEA
ncbi:MAG: cupin domain-containing protein [Actinomycetota bacterium]|nr:cupin domain-containing protein [Actinomycetota bacterium]